MAKKEKEIKIAPQYTEKGRLAKLGIKDPNELATKINTDFNSSEQAKYLWIPQRAEDLKSYYGVTQPAEWPFKGASRIKSQFQRIIVDTLSGNLLKSLFSPEHPIAVLPSPIGANSSNDTLDNIQYVEDLHNALQAHEYNLRQTLDRAIPASLIESFIILHPVYEYETQEFSLDIRRWVPADVEIKDLTYDVATDSVTTYDGKAVQAVNPETDEMTPPEMKAAGLQEVSFNVFQEECVKDGVSLKVINGYRFYMPVGTPGENPYEKVSRAPYVIHQLYYTIGEVKQKIEEGYFENVDPVIASVYDRQRELLTYIKLQEAGFLLDTARMEYEYVEVLKWSGKWKIDGKLREVTVWMDRGSNQIFRAEMNIYGMRPYFPLVPFPVDETPYGESLCKIIRPLVKEIDLLMRTITNIALMKSAPPKFFDPASGFNPSTIGNFGPNSWIPAREPARNILQPQSPEDPAVAMQMLQFLINIVERITGVSEVIQGQTSGKSNTTLGEVQQALSRAGVRFDTLYDRLKDQMKPMFKYIHKLTLRNMPEMKEVMLMGADNKGRLLKIHKAQLEGAFEFELAGNSVVREQQELQNAQTLLGMLMQPGSPATAYLSYKPESIYYVLYNFVKRLNPVAKDKILPKPEEVQKIEQQNQEAQRQQEQQAMQMQQGQGQAQAQQMQAEMQMKMQEHQAGLHGKMQEMEIKQAEHNQKIHQNDAEFSQKLAQKEKEHQLKLKQMEEAAHAKAKETKPKE